MPPSTASVGPAQPHWEFACTESAGTPGRGDSRSGIAAICNGRIPQQHRSCEDGSLTPQIISDARVRTRTSATTDIRWGPPSRVSCLAQRQQQEWKLFVVDANHARLGGGRDTPAAEAGVVCEHNISVKAFLAFKKTSATAEVGGHVHELAEDGRTASMGPVPSPACRQEAPGTHRDLDTPENRQAHIEHLRAVYRGEAKPTPLATRWTEGERPGHAAGDAIPDARAGIPDMPDLWIDEKQECIFLREGRPAELELEESEDEDDWAPQDIDFAAGVDDVCAEVSSPRLRMEEASYEDEESVRMRSGEEKLELPARGNRLVQANEALANMPEPEARKSRKVRFHQYEIVKEFDRSENGHVIDNKPLRVFYAKTMDGLRRDLPAGSVTRVPFLIPEIAWEQRNGITVRAPHFKLVMKETRPTKNIDDDERRASAHEGRVTRVVPGQAPASAAPVPSPASDSLGVFHRSAVLQSSELHAHGGLPADGQAKARIDVEADEKVRLKQQEKAAKARQAELEKVDRYYARMARKGIGYYGFVSTRLC